mmetsp:Transcript_43696/g.106830  ORF Transcript_43696/g.106830 Transcript_43696/m.106830 type:complete len:289 (-) Transcript_43696:296-1162(-)
MCPSTTLTVAPTRHCIRACSTRSEGMPSTSRTHASRTLSSRWGRIDTTRTSCTRRALRRGSKRALESTRLCARRSKETRTARDRFITTTRRGTTTLRQCWKRASASTRSCALKCLGTRGKCAQCTQGSTTWTFSIRRASRLRQCASLAVCLPSRTPPASLCVTTTRLPTRSTMSSAGARRACGTRSSSRPANTPTWHTRAASTRARTGRSQRTSCMRQKTCQSSPRWPLGCFEHLVCTAIWPRRRLGSLRLSVRRRRRCMIRTARRGERGAYRRGSWRARGGTLGRRA